LPIPENAFFEQAVFDQDLSQRLLELARLSLELLDLVRGRLTRRPVRACSLVSSLLLNGATMSQESSLTQSAHSVRQVLTAYTSLCPRQFLRFCQLRCRQQLRLLNCSPRTIMAHAMRAILATAATLIGRRSIRRISQSRFVPCWRA